MEVLVTGATSGVGVATCLEIAPNVKKIIAIGRDQTRMGRLLNQLSDFRIEVEPYCLDFFDIPSFEGFLKSISNSLSTIEGAVHAIGGMHKYPGLSEWDDFSRAFELNLGFSHRINLELIPKMRIQEYGKIVHVSSLVTKSHNGLAPYVVSKSAIESYVGALSREISKSNPGININCVAPGPLNVEYKGLSRLAREDHGNLLRWLEQHGVISGRLGKTEEIASAIRFLLSEGSDFMYGSVLNVDGGGF